LSLIWVFLATTTNQQREALAMLCHVKLANQLANLELVAREHHFFDFASWVSN